MLDNRAYNKIKEDLNKVVAYYAMQDYKRANENFKPFTASGRSRKHGQYSLSPLTTEAHELYKVMYYNKPESLTKEQESDIKAYLLRIKRTTEILWS